MPILFVFILGLFIGSFLNVVIFRLHSGESIVFGRSHCPVCKKELSWYELIPLVSFLMQGGKCRNCKTRLSLQYPIVELATGLLFSLSLIVLPFVAYIQYPIALAWQYFLHNGIIFLPGAQLAAMMLPLFLLWSISAISLVIFVYDIRYFLIPDGCILAGVGLVLFFEAAGLWHVPTLLQLLGIVLPPHAYLFDVLATAAACALPFFAIVFFSSGEWMGLGDVKLAFLMGTVLGMHALPAMFLGVVTGAIIGVALMLFGRAGMKTLMPFGPFLIFGMLLMLFFGQAILGYLGGYFFPVI